MLSGCGGTISSKERCSGANYEQNCTFSYKSSEGKWSTDLEGDRQHHQIVINGTISVTAGSGTLFIEGEDRVEEFPISAGEPVELTDVTMTLRDPFDEEEDDPYVVLGTRTDGTLEGLTGEVTYSTS